MKSEVRILLIFLTGIILGTLFFTRMFVCQRSDTVHNGDIMCYDVDSMGDLYVGYMRAIEVYHEGEHVRTINPQTTKGYEFCIENDEIYIDAYTGTYSVMSLEGEVLQRGVEGISMDTTGGPFDKSMEQDGKTYKLLKHAGFKPGEILRDGEQIYQESNADCFWNGAYFWLIWGVFFIVFFCLLIDFFESEGMVGNWWK